ncbi:ABC transporter substrate-binding protein [Nocardia vaccinii]|uniref:ABC transporter substrate-binding protein n=1 Tax=Nocardia vaccinii TaxID=1822 RepID=UPI000AB4B1B2|nr:ABC transporter substrate-binding protein [Nocardia vaccinii]
MSIPHLDIAITRYDNTRALFDGSVIFDGLDVTLHSPAIPEIFAGLASGRFDVAEFGLTHYLRALDAGAGLVAIPVFPARVFRHSAIFVNTSKGITGPADLIGRTIGEFGMYGQDSGIWAKGMLAEDYGFAPEHNRWVVGGLETPLPAGFDFTTHPHPDNVEVGFAPPDRTLADMLDRGEIDALFASNAPAAYLAGSPNIAPLFPDHETRERDWYRRTGIFPMMHTVVARRALFEGNPGLAQRLYRSFRAAKDTAADRYREMRRLFQVTTMVPWMYHLFEENRQLFPEDWFPYGIDANRKALGTFLRYSREQGLSPASRAVDELFAEELRNS